MPIDAFHQKTMDFKFQFSTYPYETPQFEISLACFNRFIIWIRAIFLHTETLRCGD